MQGSLIFVVIVAIWAAFLVQHWVRRREHAAAARSADAFSAGMRVLQRRSSAARASVTPARSPLSARSGSRRQVAAVPSVTGSPAARPETSRPTTARPQTAEVPPMTPPRRPSTVRPEGPTLGQRRLRAGLLLAALLWVPVSVVLVATGTLTWISIPFSLLTVAAVVVWLRTEAASDRARSRDEYVVDDAADAFVPSVDDTQAVASHLYARPSQTGRSSAAPAESPAASSPSPAVSSASKPFDLQAETAAASARPTGPSTGSPAAPAVQGSEVAEPAAGTWSPVPVPRPTYTLKAKAEPRLTENGIPADVFATPEFADEADELDERGLFARRAASQ
ncbi:hypothetical protein [Terracoccus luteus]|uniref:Membrane protein implicated in regulation of membrane protease activity n=1 Tax=Terracoccus luteus TaxID=53356 RepID=A0A839PR90_9MICO|nr:hypothetical protein [Terracoccus luteus]MBB2986017.1 membrane protein implicated in regulation of membrane protease activity [Terracoccus luteus]MCP2171669.1 membrane protein implicated in regulation of membrane protease activity [Terracoccus luteus]